MLSIQHFSRGKINEKRSSNREFRRDTSRMALKFENSGHNTTLSFPFQSITLHSLSLAPRIVMDRFAFQKVMSRTSARSFEMKVDVIIQTTKTGNTDRPADLLLVSGVMSLKQNLTLQPMQHTTPSKACKRMGLPAEGKFRLVSTIVGL